MSAKDLNVFIKELIDKEIEKVMDSVKGEVREIISVIDSKIEELRQYLKT